MVMPLMLASKNVDVFQNCMKTIVNSASNTWNKVDWSLYEVKINDGTKDGHF